jgi:uncharacterized lipoprotein YbaY
VLEQTLQFSFSFNKRNILISIRYQLHSASATTKSLKNITDAHNPITKKKKKKNKRFCYGDQNLVAAPQTTIHQAQPIKAKPWVFLLKQIRPLKTMPLKTIASH